MINNLVYIISGNTGGKSISYIIYNPNFPEHPNDVFKLKIYKEKNVLDKLLKLLINCVDSICCSLIELYIKF